jgi:hypothetical protein
MLWQLPGPAVAVVSDSQQSHTLERCISRYSKNQCQDPRDKVYGLLGLTSEWWQVQIGYLKAVSEVCLDVVMALYEELFDMLDPACHYKLESQDDFIKEQYRTTLLTLAGAMGLPTHQVDGVLPFLKHLQETFLSTTHRNVQFTYREDITHGIKTAI